MHLNGWLNKVKNVTLAVSVRNGISCSLEQPPRKAVRLKLQTWNQPVRGFSVISGLSRRQIMSFSTILLVNSRTFERTFAFIWLHASRFMSLMYQRFQPDLTTISECKETMLWTFKLEWCPLKVLPSNQGRYDSYHYNRPDHTDALLPSNFLTII